MDTYRMTNDELAAQLAASLKAWRVSPSGAAMTQADLAQKSGVGLTPLKRFEKTGAITLRNLIALLRALDLLDGLLGIVPDADSPNPLDVLAAAQKKSGQARQRAPRSHKG
jgi:transcriptional regulator with XRE-family HTH domain